jgi:hypothetical protein
MTINTNISFHNYEDWAAFLNFLLKEDLMSYGDMIDDGFIILDKDELCLSITPDIINRKLKLGSYYVWIENGFDRLGPISHRIIQYVETNPPITSNWIVNIEDAMARDDREQMQTLGVDWI